MEIAPGRVSRLFIALEVPDELKAALLRTPIPMPRSRPTPRGRLHLTLRFLGDTPAELTKRLIKYIQDEFRLIEPVRLIPQGIGFFPNLRHVSSMHLRLELTPELWELKERLDRDLHRLAGIREENSFKAHITLLRMRSSPSAADFKGLSGWGAALELPETRAARLILFLSRQERGRQLHAPIASCSCCR